MNIDVSGVHLDSFSDIFSSLTESFKAIYGQDINLDQDTPDGQVIGIYANTVYDMQSLIARIYNSFDPDFAEGHELDKILKLIASSRLPATKSLVDIDITTNASVSLLRGYEVGDVDGQSWTLLNNSDLLMGITTLSFEAKRWGAISAIPHAINKPVTIITEVDSIDNQLPAVEGRDEESDILLRKRRNRLLSLGAKSSVYSIVSRLLNIETVADVIVHENMTNAHDPTRDIEGHTIWIVVDGGDIEDIVEVIATDKNAGCGLKGSVDGIHEELFTRANGTTRTHYHSIKFDRPTETEIYIRLNVKKRIPSDVIDKDLITKALVEKLYNINEDIGATSLYETVYSASNTFIASDLELSLDGSSWVDDVLVSGFAERLIIVDSNIEITEIV